MDLSQIEAVLSALSDEDKAEVARLAGDELAKPFIPNPGPQSQALDSQADILLYGGAAGGGKSALEIGAFFDSHHSGLILRREATQLDGLIAFAKEIGEPHHGRFVAGSDNVFKRHDGGRLKFAGLNQPDSWRKHAGNARDYMAFDEAGEFLKEQVFSLIGWLRSTREGQRCRVILGSNPPRGGDGEWMIEEFAPWLDPMAPNPAAPGELRWAIVVAGVTEWVDGPGVYKRADEDYEAMSRTFIPARLDDNPYLKDTNYRAVLQGLPEPLRSQLLKGDFLAGREDHQWQVIPTAWVKAANERWERQRDKRRQMIALAADIAMGGPDNTVIGALRTGAFFDQFEVHKGIDTKNPLTIAELMLKARRDGALCAVDLTGGWGSGVKSHLENNLDTPCLGIVFSEKGAATTRDGRFGFHNKRAEMWWQFREALDPEGGNDELPALPPDPRLTAELTTPRWELRGTNVLIESKQDIAKRVGGSTDRADTAVMLWSLRHQAAVRQDKRQPRGGWTEVAPDEGLLDW